MNGPCLWAALTALGLSACLSPTTVAPIDALAGVDDVPSRTRGEAGLEEPAPLSLSIGTLNAHRFFDTSCDSGSCGDSSFEPSVSQDQFDGKVRALARAIEEMNATFVLLQEVESEVCLDALSARLGDRYPLHYLAEVGTPASPDVAVLGEGELLEVVLHRHEPIALQGGGTTNFAREFPEVHVIYQEQHVILMPLHFRSKHNDKPEQRLAEASAARVIATEVAERYPEAIVILGGDVNDTPGSPPMEALEAGDHHAPVYVDLPAHKRWTYEYKSAQSMLDHLFIARGSAGQLVGGSTRVVREDALGGWPSDHAGLVSTISEKSSAFDRP